MQRQNDLAVNLMNLFDPNSYVEFGSGYFTNRPEMAGYFYIFKKLRQPKFCLILNMSEQQYPSDMVKIKDCVFIIYNVASLEEFVNNLPETFLPNMLETISQHMQKKNARTLPYGYYYDENGDLKIDLKKADEVRRIYNRYVETESVRTIASEMRTNFSHVRDILHDNEEYSQMPHKILPLTLLKQVNGLLAENVKGRYRKQTGMDKLKAAKQRAKKLEKEAQERIAQNEQQAQQP